MLEIQGISAGYERGSTVLHGVSLNVQSGEIVALVGANGAGKTTLMRCIMGGLKLQAGRILFEGEELTGLSGHVIARKGIAISPEGRRLFPHMTVAENLGIAAEQRLPRSRWGDKLVEVLELFPALQGKESRLAATLSGGEQQMVAISRALMAQPRLLLLDEPSLGLAPRLIERVFAAIAEIRQRGITVLLVEQNARVALECASRAYVLRNGRMVGSGPARELLHDGQMLEGYLGGVRAAEELA